MLFLNLFSKKMDFLGAEAARVLDISRPTPSDAHDLYTCVDLGKQGRQGPCGRVVNERPGVLCRNHITSLAEQLKHRNTSFS